MCRFNPFLLAAFSALAALAAPAYSQAVPASVGARAPAGTYSVNVSNGSVFMNALVTTNSAGHAIAVSGWVNNSSPITGLSSYAGADNDLYVTGSWVTYGGLSVSTISLGDFNIYNSGAGYYGLLGSLANANGYADGRIAIVGVTPVPEPSSWLMMLFGFGGVGLQMRRRRSARCFAQAA